MTENFFRKKKGNLLDSLEYVVNILAFFTETLEPWWCTENKMSYVCFRLSKGYRSDVALIFFIQGVENST